MNNQLSGDIEYQLEKGSVATAYEPYKSITLSTPQDLELRKVGEVQDEVNVMTGEVTENLIEFSINSKISLWGGPQPIHYHTNTSRFYINITNTLYYT